MSALGIIFSNIHDDNLPELTAKRTMGSIPFGGRYRLIDFPLSSMVNSQISKVGVITKNNYQSLMDHVGSGKDWDLARKNGGLVLLPPFFSKESGSLYQTRLEALKGIVGFLNHSYEEYVVLTDCDCVYAMDYNKVIKFHAENDADVTMVYRCAVDDASKNAYIETDSTGRITEIVSEDKASADKERNYVVNVFVMKRTFLINLITDAISHGHHHFLQVMTDSMRSLRLFGYRFDGYIATMDSMLTYYNSNMQLLDEKVRNELFTENAVYTKVRDSAPTKYGNAAVVENSLIADGCVIEGEVHNSILFRGVKVGRGAVISNAILMQDTQVLENATVNCIIADKNVLIREKSVLSGSIEHPFYLAKNSRA